MSNKLNHSLIEKASRASQDKKWKKALKYWQKVIDGHELQAPVLAYSKLSEAWRRLGKIEKAKETLSEGYNIYGDHLHLMIESALLAIEQKQWTSGIEYAQTIIDQSSEPDITKKAIDILYISLIATGRFEEAHSTFVKLNSKETGFEKLLENKDLRKIINLLIYTKTSGKPYASSKFPAGYQSLSISGNLIPGRHDPKKRFAKLPVDFCGKTVLDIGSNQGGMLFEIANDIKWGVGLDYDYTLVNVANMISRNEGYNNLMFYTFDLTNESLPIIQNFLPDDKIDYVFLFRTLGWVENWEAVLEYSSAISDKLIIQINGPLEKQLSKINNLYQEVVQLTDSSEESTTRDIYLCSNVPGKKTYTGRSEHEPALPVREIKVSDDKKTPAKKNKAKANTGRTVPGFGHESITEIMETRFGIAGEQNIDRITSDLIQQGGNNTAVYIHRLGNAAIVEKVTNNRGEFETAQYCFNKKHKLHSNADNYPVVIDYYGGVKNKQDDYTLYMAHYSKTCNLPTLSPEELTLLAEDIISYEQFFQGYKPSLSAKKKDTSFPQEYLLKMAGTYDHTCRDQHILADIINKLTNYNLNYQGEELYFSHGDLDSANIALRTNPQGAINGFVFLDYGKSNLLPPGFGFRSILRRSFINKKYSLIWKTLLNHYSKKMALDERIIINNSSLAAITICIRNARKLEGDPQMRELKAANGLLDYLLSNPSL